ncbi:hypothetical protein MBLNU13_g07557t2 [Cladosporium sp. NU13]
MVRNKKTHGKKRLDSPSNIITPSMTIAPTAITTTSTIATPSTDDIVSTKYADATTFDHTTTPYLPNANAAGTVFNTSNGFELRFPESQEQLGRIIVEAHPVLEVRSEFEPWSHGRPLYSFGLAWHTNRQDLVTDDPFVQTMSMSCEVVEKLPAQALLLQPPVT